MNATFLFLLLFNFTFFNLHVAFNRYPSFVCLLHGTAVFPLLLIAMGSNSPSFQAVLGSSMLSKIEQGITYSIAVPTKSSPNSNPPVQLYLTLNEKSILKVIECAKESNIFIGLKKYLFWVF